MGMFDSLTNLVAQIGTGKSKAAVDQFGVSAVSDVQLDAMYRGDWLGRKIIDVPVRDMLRPWRAWQTDEAKIEAIELAEKRHAIKAKLALALRAARLYGGAAIIIGDGSPRPSEPLLIDKIAKGGLKYLTVVPRRQLNVTEMERDPASPHYNEPKMFTLASSTGGTASIHPTRVLRFTGADRLDFDLNPDGWGDSVLLSVYDAIHHAALTQAGIAELVHEAKVDVISVPNLGSNLSTDAGTSALAKRFTNAAALKSINNMLLLDDSEKWDRKQTTFAGLTDVLDRYLQIVAGASDIPATRLLGTQAKGLGETGQGDLTNYYDMLAGIRDDTLGPILDRLDRILWRDAIGAVPDEAYPEWRPYWQMSEKDRADVANKKAQTTKVYFDMGLLPDDALAKGVANQLIEDAVYPGIEAELAAVQSAGAREGEEVDETDDPADPA